MDSPRWSHDTPADGGPRPDDRAPTNDKAPASGASFSAARLAAEALFQRQRPSSPAAPPVPVVVLRKRARAALAGLPSAGAESAAEAAGSRSPRVFRLGAEEAAGPAAEAAPAQAEAGTLRRTRRNRVGHDRRALTIRHVRLEPGRGVQALVGEMPEGLQLLAAAAANASAPELPEAQQAAALRQALARVDSLVAAIAAAQAFTVVDPRIAAEWSRLAQMAGRIDRELVAHRGTR